jgi:diaminopimelate decarboxylase
MSILKPPYENRDGNLYLDGVSCVNLAEKYETPLYVYSEQRIRDNYRRLIKAFQKRYKKVRVLYAMKANSNLEVLRVLREEGCGIDAVSPGEVYLALEAGFNNRQILFTGTSVGKDELKYLIDRGVDINVDSASQLDKILEERVPEMISVRVNPQLGAGHHEHVITAGHDVKFGVWEDEAVKLISRAMEAGVERFGLHMHIGSGIMDADHHVKAGERLLEVAGRIRRSVGVSLSFIDLGGGIGVPYRPEEKEVDLDDYSRKIVGLFVSKITEHELGEPELWLEPGRFLVADSGALLTRVTTVKTTPARRFLGVDAGFNTLLRPVLYGAYHYIVAASNIDGPPDKVDVYGPLCESGDFFARDRDIPRVSEGDLLAVLTTGAYGYSMSSQYNARPRPAEVMVRDGVIKVIRRRESFEDLVRGEHE